MTSSRLFFRVMKEDMRHRGWMIALSVLASVLALPVIWLLVKSNGGFSRLVYDEKLQSAPAYILDVVEKYWERAITPCGGLVAIGGALIAALAGFRFLFHKDQVDTWHSMPIKRDMLFGAYYLNGILVWLLPLLAMTVLLGIWSAGLAVPEGGERTELLKVVLRAAAEAFGVFFTAFFLAYNLALLAMMLCGNALNTIVSTLILGFGVGIFMALYMCLCESYFYTYFGLIGDLQGNMGIMSSYASPLLSAFYLLIEGEKTRFLSVWVNLLVAVFLGVCAWLLYRRRPSELSEQGIRNRVFSTALRLVATVGAGVTGWIIFYGIAEGSTTWGVFGAVLAAVLTHGVMDVAFRMEFRAFFAHKIQLAACLAAVLLICFAFYWDWFGYDAYLPEKEKIAEFGLDIIGLGNGSSGLEGEAGPLEGMEYQDAETAYALLQQLTARERQAGKMTAVNVRVTLKSGTTYYRTYYMGEAQKAFAMPILADGEYLKHSFLLEEQTVLDYQVGLCLQCGENEIQMEDCTKEEILSIIHAYNQDVLDNPETVLLGEGRQLAWLELQFRNESSGNRWVRIDVYETMNRTIEALKAMGYGEYVTCREASEIASIQLYTDADAGTSDPAEIVEAARQMYKVYGESGKEDGEAAGRQPAVSYETSNKTSNGDIGIGETGKNALVLNITDREEIRELLGIISYAKGNGRNVFKKDFIPIQMTDKNGEKIVCYVKAGELPEKYILRFGETAED